MEHMKIRVGSRASRLAVVQSELIIARIQEILPKAQVELVKISTTGDRILDKPLDQIGGKGLFLRELETALLTHRVDLCIHSLKDVPMEENLAIPIGACFQRGVPWDVFVLPRNTNHWNRKLPIGCASARRARQFQILCPDAWIVPIRGNVLTRLEKLDQGEYGALILAEAGLTRLGLENRIAYRFSPEEMVPASGQGILAVQGRTGEYSALLAQLNDPDTALCARAERICSRRLGGDCSAPVGCYATVDGDSMLLYGFSGIGKPVRQSIQGAKADAEQLAEQLARQLKE